MAEQSKTIRTVGVASVVIALMQSLCTAVIAVSGIRLIIGLTALAAVSGVYEPADGFHQDAIRIPMLAIATIGAFINLFVLYRIWSLRARTAGDWRRREVSAKEKRSERLQLGIAIFTLILVIAETCSHAFIFRTGKPAPAAAHTTSQTK